jgi:hypothetical protein
LEHSNQLLDQHLKSHDAENHLDKTMRLASTQTTSQQIPILNVK